MSVEERVKSIIVEQLGVDADEVTPDASFVEDLGADSLDLLELVFTLEEALGTSIPDADAAQLRTLADVLGYIEQRGVVSPAGSI